MMKNASEYMKDNMILYDNIILLFDQVKPWRKRVSQIRVERNITRMSLLIITVKIAKFVFVANVDKHVILVTQK